MADSMVRADSLPVSRGSARRTPSPALWMSFPRSAVYDVATREVGV